MLVPTSSKQQSQVGYQRNINTPVTDMPKQLPGII